MIKLSDCVMAATRELAMRGTVYPRRVADGRMTDAQSKYEIGIMTDILTILRTLAASKDARTALVQAGVEFQIEEVQTELPLL